MTNEQFVSGLLNFVKHEVIPNVSDNQTKMMIGTMMFAANRNPSILNPLLNVYGMDPELMIDSLSDSIHEYGNVVITIPKIPLISPAEQTLSFNSSDLEKLKQYINRC